MTVVTKPLPPHGTLSRHKQHGCRCTPCVQASRDYDNNRARQIAYGRWQSRVDIQPVLNHIEMLRGHGIGWTRVAKLAGLSEGILSRWLYGSANQPPPRTVKAASAAKVLAVRPTLDNIADHALIDGTGTHRRLQSLVAIGWPNAALARHMGMDTSNYFRIYNNTQVHAGTARQARDLFTELWNTNPINCGIDSRSYSKAVNYARRKEWPPPMAWLNIDDPDEYPTGWKRRGDRHCAEGLVEDAKFITITSGVNNLNLIAARIGVKRNTLEKAHERVAARAKRKQVTA